MRMDLNQYENRIVRVVDHDGKSFTGVPASFPPDYGMHEFDREEESIRLNDYMLFESDIAEIRELPAFSIIRATETWQQAGAYYVRIQAMLRKHHISLQKEFDEHDGPDTKYIVITDDGFPVGTARMYPLDDRQMMIGRVVVLPEYRRQGIGSMVVSECEEWAEELHYSRAVVESRDNKIEFYEQMLYESTGEVVDGEVFRCIRMEKDL